MGLPLLGGSSHLVVSNLHYKPFRRFIRGKNPFRGLTITHPWLENHLQPSVLGAHPPSRFDDAPKPHLKGFFRIGLSVILQTPFCCHRHPAEDTSIFKQRGVEGRQFQRSMVVEMVPLKGGIGGIVHPPIGSIYHLYTTYSPCLLGGQKCYLPPFRGTISTTIEKSLGDSKSSGFKREFENA